MMKLDELGEIRREMDELCARKVVAAREHREALGDCLRADGSPDTTILDERRDAVCKIDARMRELTDLFNLASIRESRKVGIPKKTSSA